MPLRPAGTRLGESIAASYVMLALLIAEPVARLEPAITYQVPG
ncbi:MAG: hypothetical protein ACK5Z4_15040 [Planctomyces sp.]